MMILQFTLSMPGVKSWNGKWSGEGTLYALFRAVSPKTATRLLDEGYFTYAFGDGWIAGVTVTHPDTKDLRKLRKKSSGFMGYDWMISEIIYHGRIRSHEERTKKAENAKAITKEVKA